MDGKVAQLSIEHKLLAQEADEQEHHTIRRLFLLMERRSLRSPHTAKARLFDRFLFLEGDIEYEYEAKRPF
jgi:hypothetical protein